MTKVLKICCSEWRNASRDKRELTLCREMGMDVLVLAKGKEEAIDNVDGFEVHRLGTRPWGGKFPNAINRFVSIFHWARVAHKMNPDVISGHDIDGLLVGFLSTLLAKEKPKLVYDSHEFELGRNTNRSKLSLLLIKKLEGFLIRRCEFSIMVNDSIADLVQNIYKLEKRPVVVRSTPNYWEIDPCETQKKHEEFCEALHAPKDAFIVMYHGGVLPGRGIETLIKLLNINNSIYGVILGNGADSYLKSLHSLAEDLHVSGRLLFHPAVPLKDLWRYVGAADLGLILIPALCENHRLSLPNKFFENIQSETPIVCPNYPAMGEIVSKYGNGSLFESNDVENINKKVEELKDNRPLYSQKKDGAIKAKEDLCWEKESIILQSAYNELVKQGGVISYYFMLPNKFFECVQSETPIIASNYPEMIRLIGRFKMGALVEPLAIDDINNLIESIRLNKDTYALLKDNIKKAKSVLCWEKEKHTLLEAYATLL